MVSEENGIKPIALYLPQYHPIPENDKWWGKGFTEWTNVTKAKPLFKGHWQPRLPADLGFYDLRVPEVREAQANLAKEYGIYGFCYWHYWFGGKRVLDRPFREVVKSGKPDFPFCIAWANQTWKGTWHGLSNKEVLIEQTYPGKEDYTSHFYSLLEAFWDKRYIEVKGKKMVYIFQPLDFPDSMEFIGCWQELAIKEGLNGFHFVAMHMPPHWQLQQYGYDAMLADGMMELDKFIIPEKKLAPARIWNNFFSKKREDSLQRFSYREYVNGYPWQPLTTNQYPWVLPDWDNTPRTPKTGWLFQDSSPELFGDLCMKAFRETENKPEDEKIVLLKSWNEWAEGNYLEPDSKYGTAYLENFRNALNQYSNL